MIILANRHSGPYVCFNSVDGPTLTQYNTYFIEQHDRETLKQSPETLHKLLKAYRTHKFFLKPPAVLWKSARRLAEEWLLV